MKKLLTLILILTSFNIIADERAPRSQCYINGGWATEANIDQKIRELDVRPELLEMYERSDKQIYLTLGKIDRDLWKKVKSSLNSSYSCSSGKGYLKRVFANQDSSSLSYAASDEVWIGRVIKSKSELISLIKPSLSSYIAEADRLAEQKRLSREKERARAAKLYAERKRTEQVKQNVVLKNPNNSLSTSSPNDDIQTDPFERSIAETVLEFLDNNFWWIISGLFLIYLTRKSMQDSKKRAELEKKRVEAEEKAYKKKKKQKADAKKLSDTLKSFKKDYPLVDPSKLELLSKEYVASKSDEEQSKILTSLKEDDAAKRIEKAAEAEERKRKKEEREAKRKEEETKRKEELRLKLEKQEAARMQKINLLETNYGEKVAQAFAKNKVEIGMPISYVNEIKGQGHERKRSVSRDGESIKEKYGKYYKKLSSGSKSSNPSYRMEIEYERSEDGNLWLVAGYKDY